MTEGTAKTTDQCLSLSPDGSILEKDLEALRSVDEIDVYLAALAELEPSDSTKLQVTQLAGRVDVCIARDMDKAQKKAELEAAGLLELTLSVLMRHSRDEPVVCVCLEILVHMARGRADLRERLEHHKCVQLVVRALLYLRGSLGTQTAGCALLLELSLHAGNRELMGKFFAIEVAISAMKTFGESDELTALACALLANVCYESKRNKEVIMKAGGVKALLRALKTWKSDEVVVGWSTLALRNLSVRSPEMAAALVKLGGVRFLIGGLLSFKHSLKVHEHTLACLRNVMENRQEAVKQVAQLHGIDLAVNAMRIFRNETHLQVSCVAILRHIAGIDAAHAKLVLAGGGLEAVLSTMIVQRANAAVQEVGISFVHRIAQLGPEAKAWISKAGGEETLSMTLKTHITNESLVEEGAAAIRLIRKRQTPLKTGETRC